MARVSQPTVAQRSAADIDELRELYVWENETDVRRELMMHPEIHEPLMQAARIIPNYFGPETWLSLRVVHEYDGTGPDSLVAYIHMSQPPQTALDNFARFDDDWWLDLAPRIGDVLLFMLRFE
jgi:hypothetical protein